MSAYIVDGDHIAYLVHAALSERLLGGERNFTWYWGGAHRVLERGDGARASEVGQMLWDENVRSVSHRYPDDTADIMPGKRTLPGPTEAVLIYLHGRSPWREIDPVQVLKAISCYEYQTCEHEDWEASEAFAFCRALRGVAIAALPGYSGAAWGAPERPKARRRV